jgi:hypothetical protein
MTAWVDFEANGEGALGDAVLLHELLDSVGDAFLGELPVNSNSTIVSAASLLHSRWRCP